MLSKVTSEIDRTLGKRASVVSYVSDASQAVSDLNGVKSIALGSLVGAVGAAVVILFFVMVMIVRERNDPARAEPAAQRPAHLTPFTRRSPESRWESGRQRGLWPARPCSG